MSAHHAVLSFFSYFVLSSQHENSQGWHCTSHVPRGYVVLPLGLPTTCIALPMECVALPMGLPTHGMRCTSHAGDFQLGHLESGDYPEKSLMRCMHGMHR